MSDENGNLSSPKIQSSGREMDLTSTVGDEFIEFDIEVQSIFQRLAEDIYKDTKDGIREPLANAITAVLTAQKKYDLENPVIEVSVRDGPQPRLIIQDNGIGISEDVLRKALAVIGKTTHLQEGDMLGRYGIGFLACYKLVGPDGGFFMFSRSRETDETLSGMWKPGGFDIDSDNEFENPFEENQSYGTRFEFDVKPTISVGEIRSWVAEFTKWARVPVIYREYDSNWEEKFSEDYGVKSLKDKYSEDTEVLKVETDEFVAYCTPEADGETLLLDTPIERNYTLDELPFDVDIRFKTENEVLVTGEHAGKIAVSRSAYKKIPDELQSKYVQQNRVSAEAISLPGPTGTRDSLKQNKQFWNWLVDKLTNKYISAVQQIMKKFTDIESLYTVTTKERNFVIELLSKDSIRTTTAQRLQDSLADKDIFISEEIAKELCRLRRRYKVVNREITSGGNIRYEQKRVWEIIQQTETNGDVFMGCQLTSKKIRAALEDDKDNIVVKIRSADNYEMYKEKYNWRKLQDISWQNIEKFDVPQAIEDLFVAPEHSDSSAKTEKITIYYNEHYGGTKEETRIKRNPEKIKEEIQENNLGPNNISKLIVFPQAADRNVTDNKYIASTNIGVASCTAAQLETLQELPSVITAKSYFANAKLEEITTSNGTQKIKDTDIEDVVFHVLPYEIYDIFTEQENIEQAEEYVQTKVEGFGNQGITEGKINIYKDSTYVPISKRQLNRIRPYLSNANVLTGDVSYDMGNIHRLSYDVKIYAYIRLPHDKRKSEIETLQNLNVALKNGGKQLVEAIRE